ncbi:NADP-dependent oxidoreductase domain-containing protein [Naematelia encephala]|uniref:NADP-dependent oxidoreductase domain-containing protein n=1 Tax=Naematelia encephala TaxID=71784 RepID=A0A1Y2AUF1_9TREE|nr:NADP-dependent oxidoreductase domain-containing protein [Naematelia encephala]
MSLPKLLLSNGRRIPVLGYGLGTANYGRDSSDAVVLALRQGYLHLDGAEAYANDESIRIGLERSGVSRKDIFYTTKCSSKDPRAALLKSLKTLNLEYVDLYLLHSPEYFEEIGLAKAWEMCEEMQTEGLCKSIGVSNFRVKDLKKLAETAKVTPVINQIEFHPYLYKETKPLLDYCKEHAITIAAWGPLTPLTNAKNGPVDVTVAEIAKSTGYTPGQVLLKWCQQVTGGVVLTTSSKASRLQEQMVPFISMPDLTDAQVEAIIENGKSKHFRTYMPHMDE